MGKKPQKSSKKFSRRNLFSMTKTKAIAIAKAMQKEATTITPVNQISRKEAIARIGGGALALGLASRFGGWLRQRMPYWAGAERKNNLEFFLTRHDEFRHADEILRVIDKSKNPVHVFFRETAGIPRSELPQIIKQHKENEVLFKQNYNRLRSQGLSDSQAKTELFNLYRQATPNVEPFYIKLEIELAVRGIHVVPIEFYSAEESARITEFQKEVSSRASVRKRLEDGNAPLLEMQNFEIQSGKRLYEITALRDRRIVEQMPELFEIVRQSFPELRGKTINAFGAMGTSHGNVYLRLDEEKSKVRIAELHTHTETYSILDYIGVNKTGFRQISEKDARLLCLHPYVSQNIKRLAEQYGRKDLADRCFKKALSLGQNEFIQLNDATEKMDKQNRMRYIMNYFVGQNYF